MTTPTHDHLAHLTRHIQQLTQPITIPIARRHNNRGPTWRTAITHPPLLDQLRDASTPSSQTLTVAIRRRHHESTPPLAAAALDTLAYVYIGISTWHQLLHLPSPNRSLDWQKAALQQLATAAHTRQPDGSPAIAPSITEALAAAVEDWWESAARASGWRPSDLRNAS